jgi:hypothetical protein
MTASCGGRHSTIRGKATESRTVAAAMRTWQGALIGFGSRLEV